MAGLDLRTGGLLVGWPDVEQSIGVILSTRFGERVLREWFGSFVPQLLGENITEATILRFVQALAVAIELWEPRFKLRRAYVEGTPEMLRAGKAVFVLLGDYRPRALQGDFTIEGARELRRPINPIFG